MASKYGGRVTTVKAQSIGERTGAFDVRNINIKDLVENEDNEKLFSMDQADLKRLSDDIKKNGVLDPIWVVENKNGTYKIESGHRRVKASKMAGLERIPAIVNGSIDEVKEREILVKSNLLSREITPVQLARLIEYHEETVRLDHKGEPKFQVAETVMKEFGLTKTNYYIYKKLLKLEDELLKAIDEFKLPFRPFVDSQYYEQSKDIQIATAQYIKEKIKETGELGYGEISEILKKIPSGKETPPKEKKVKLFVDDDIKKISKKMKKIDSSLSKDIKIENKADIEKTLCEIESYIADIRKHM